jgi:hypothetical protein
MLTVMNYIKNRITRSQQAAEEARIRRTPPENCVVRLFYS